MKAFIEEYGLVILVLAVIAILIAMTTPLGDIIMGAIENALNSLSSAVTGSEPATTSATQQTTTAMVNFANTFNM